MTTLLQATNEVLRRLRESEVATVTQSSYSKMIADFVNDAKRQVEDAWNWDALQTTIPLTLTPGTTTYVLTGSGLRPKDVTINDITNRFPLANVPIQWIVDQQELSNVQSGQPTYYAWNGNNGTDSKLEVYPTPDGAYVLNVSLCIPQVRLTSDSDVITVPSEIVIAGAYARALAERGEDGGLASSEAYNLFKGILSDYIAHETGRFPEYECFEAC
jgi:hypothetical protein